MRPVEPTVWRFRGIADNGKQDRRLQYRPAAKGCCVAAASALILGVTTRPLGAQCEASESGQAVASDGVIGDLFGNSVSIDGTTIIVGAPDTDDLGDQSGAAYIFQLQEGAWNEHSKLLAGDGLAGDRCGFAVAIEGDVAVVGAPYHQDAGVYSGSAYVFRFDGAIWVEEQELAASDAGVGQFFGWSVAIDGDVIVVGALGVDENGAVYVFRFGGTAWNEEDRLTIPDGAALDFFGTSVDVESGDNGVILVGAPQDDDGGMNSGSAYVFPYVGGIDPWAEGTRLTAPNLQPGDMFGSAVSLSGNVAIIAANNGDTGWDTGAAYVFRGAGANWSQEQELSAPAEAPDANEFAFAVAIEGDVAIVGAMRDDGATPTSGTAYVYSFDGANWIRQAKLIASEGSSDDLNGSSVAVSSGIAVVAARGSSFPGAVYAYDGLLDGIPDECQGVCPWDLDGGGVGITDFLILLGLWGQDPGGPPDFDGDQIVGITDFLELLAHWGECF